MPRSMPSHTRDEKTGSSYLGWLVGVYTVSWRFGCLAEEEGGEEEQWYPVRKEAVCRHGVRLVFCD